MPLQSTIGHELTSHIPHPAGWPERWARLLAATVFRPVCCLCEAPAPSPWLDLCDACAAALPRLRSVCSRCAGPLAAPPAGPRPPVEHIWAQLCAGCRLRAPACDLAVVPFVYAYPVDRLIRGLKFDGERVYGRVLGAFIAAARRDTGVPPPDLVVPVPLHRARFRERGFNQAQDLARTAAHLLGVPLAPRLVERAVATRAQAGLNAAERRVNVRHAFRIRQRPGPLRIAVVDDVMTTGSTLLELAQALKASGALEVEVWAAARAMLDVP